jgi:hypothetical protein
VEKLCCGKEAQGVEQELFHCVLVSDEEGRCYPGGRQASALVDSLLFDCNRLGVQTLTATKVVKLTKLKDTNSFSITLSNGQTHISKYVVFCVGGKAQKQFKTDGSAYALVAPFGHTVTALYPSLVQLKTETQFIKTLKGIRTLCRVNALVDNQVVASKLGDVIFTEYGVSGNAIFALSPYVVDKQGVILELEFLPEENGKGSIEEIEADIAQKKKLGYAESELLSGTLHNQLGRAIIKRCQCGDLKKIAYMVKHFTLPVVGNIGFDYAQVTKGGIPLAEVTDCLESKKVNNLFFAGEVLDVDGECGGYNLHWAFCSAAQVAKTICQKEHI